MAVEDPEDVHTDWAAGEVIQVDVDVGAASKMPYRVRLDDTGGRSVLVHRDEHRFIRSRDLQAPGPRTGATRVLDKFVTRQKKDAPGRRSTTKPESSRLRRPQRRRGRLLSAATASRGLCA